MKTRFILIAIGVMTMLSISACGQQKYKLNFDGYGFESKKKEYAAGEKVTVYYDFIATDTDYHFYIDDDVEMKESYDNDHAYIFTFIMPSHDVTLHEESHNSMVYVPPLDYTDAGIKDVPIQQGDIVDFYYTYDWVGYNAKYQRYRFYIEDGQYLFYHESRGTENDYGWNSPDDVISSGTLTLDIYEWADFLAYLKGGSIKTPEESIEDGDSGPWMYLYYKSHGNIERKEFFFSSAAQQLSFEDHCRLLMEVCENS